MDELAGDHTALLAAHTTAVAEMKAAAKETSAAQEATATSLRKELREMGDLAPLTAQLKEAEARLRYENG